MSKEKHCQLSDGLENDDSTSKQIKEDLNKFKNILNCDELKCEKCYYYNFNDQSFTCLLYYNQYEPPGIIYHFIDSKEIVIYIVRSRIKNTNDICNPEVIEIYHFTHIFSFLEFSDEELYHFRESMHSLLYDEIDNLLNSDFEYSIIS